MNRRLMILTARCAPLLLALASAVCRAGQAAPPPAEKPWRQFPDVPEILFYENFENGTTLFKEGDHKEGSGCKIVAEPPAPAGQHIFKLGEWDHERDKGNKWLYTTANISNWKAKFPNGLEPQLITISVSVHTDMPGHLHVKIKHTSGEYEDGQAVGKPNQWTPVTYKLTELRSKGSHPEAKHVAAHIELSWMTKTKGDSPKVYIDDVMITYGAAPALLLPRIQKAQTRMAEVDRVAEKDGFSYALTSQDALKRMLKAAAKPRKPKTVLLAPPTPQEAAALKTDIAEAAQKTKLGPYAVTTLAAPGGGEAGGANDLYTLLPYGVKESEAETVLIMVGAKDTDQPRFADHLKLVLERTLEVGALPVICLPLAGPDLPGDLKPKVEAFEKAMVATCTQMNLPYIDPNVPLKANKEAYDKSHKLTSAGRDALAQLLVQAIRHLELNLYVRK